MITLSSQFHRQPVSVSWKTPPRCGRVSPFLLLTTYLIPVLLAVDWACAGKIHDIKWEKNNPIFDPEGSGHVIEINRGNAPYDYDQANIICPRLNSEVEGGVASPEKYIVYNVSKEEYESCRITNPNPRIIAICDQPDKILYFTVSFRSFTPLPGGLEFRPGHDYYFISTSSEGDLHRRVGGTCKSNHMKLMLRICCHPNETDHDAVVTRPPMDTLLHRDPALISSTPPSSSSMRSSSSSASPSTTTTVVASSPTPQPIISSAFTPRRYYPPWNSLRSMTTSTTTERPYVISYKKLGFPIYRIRPQSPATYSADSSSSYFDIFNSNHAGSRSRGNPDHRASSTLLEHREISSSALSLRTATYGSLLLVSVVVFLLNQLNSIRQLL